MVMFRDFAQRKARGLGITGTVENLRDGTVEIFAHGEPEALKAFVAKLSRGSLLSRVDDVRLVEETVAQGDYKDFTIRY